MDKEKNPAGRTNERKGIVKRGKLQEDLDPDSVINAMNKEDKESTKDEGEKDS